MAQTLTELLLELAFENQYTLHPRNLSRIAEEDARFLIDCFAGEKLDEVREWGRKRARQGLGIRVVLSMGNFLRQFCLSELMPEQKLNYAIVLRAIDDYLDAYLEGYLHASEEITLHDQEQIRRALAAALEQQRFELLVKNQAIETSVQGIMLTDNLGQVTYANAAFLEMWGYKKPEDIQGLNCNDFLGDRNAAEIINMPRGSSGWHREIAGKRRDGSVFDATISASVIRDDSGAPNGIMVSYADTTEKKRLELQLRQAQKMDALGQLAGGIVHDFNNLLAVISGYSELQLMELEKDSRLYKESSQIKIAADRGKDLTDQLRFFTRQATGERKILQLNKIVEETRNLLERTFPKEINMNLHLDPDLAMVKADPSQMSHMLMNLCVNARDAMMNGSLSNAANTGDGGIITIETSNIELDETSASQFIDVQPGKYIRLTVRDTGQGMSPEVIERLFEPFFTTKSEQSGTGLGLAGVYGIIKNHDGFIDVKSQPARGSVFYVYLPEVEHTETQSVVEEREISLVPGQGTVLIIDDEPQVRNLATETLETCGYRVLTAKDGRQGLVVFEQNRDRIDLVLLDMVMPSMGGKECFSRLKALDPTVKILIITGYTTNGSFHDFLEQGAIGVLEKPFNLRTLTRTVREVIGVAPKPD